MLGGTRGYVATLAKPKRLSGPGHVRLAAQPMSALDRDLLAGDSVAASVDARALEADLGRAVRGQVRFDAGAKGIYATSGSVYRQVPIGVVVPRDVEDVVKTVEICRAHGAPLLPRGGGTSLAGQCCNIAVVVDFSKYLRGVLELDPDLRLARVQPGTVLDTLRDAAEVHQLTFAPDPATHRYCTLGGMIGNNSCGVHSVMGGRTSDNIEELEILTYDGLRMRVGRTKEEDLVRIIAAGGRRGAIYAGMKAIRDRYAELIRQRYPKIPRRVSGYNLDELLPENGFNVARALVGTEGTCAVVLEATARLVHSPPARTLVVLAYPDVYAAADAVPAILKYEPTGLEGFDDRLVQHMRKKGLHPKDLELLPDGGGWLLVEFGGNDRNDAGAKAQMLMRALGLRKSPPEMRLYGDAARARRVWGIRESGLGATARVPGEPDTSEGWEDSAVPPDRLGDYLREMRNLFDTFGYDGALYGHFGEGCIHTRINFDLRSARGIQTFRRFLDDAADLVVSFGGSLSGEHGDGQSRAELLTKMFGDELTGAFREFKALWDPEGKMNPGKVVDPYPITSNLRFGAGYPTKRLDTHFRYPSDDGSFARGTERCVGVGKCRGESGGTMCPSYMVTREEMHSTRGRAHLLFEMLLGDPVSGGWRDEHVKEALDLCLACKGCKTECPVNVDMATYKAEFLSHYYDGRIRPRRAYAMGLIDRWARIASRTPGVVNLVTHAPVLGGLLKRATGLAPQRAIPVFASETFTRWFRSRPPRNTDRSRVVLWPDTFTNYFTPDAAVACVEVLEAAGYQVVIPEQPLCCGRPLYEYGMLDTAKRRLLQILDSLRPLLREGVPLIGIEPSCLAVFRDELRELLPDDEDAKRLGAQSFMLSEFLVQEAGWRPPQVHRKALVHGHCHHKTVISFDAEEELLARLGLDFEILDSGCCGMAGSFGFAEETYGVSVACAERVLLPAVREAAGDTLIITDGFSCREQIEQLTGRRSLHIAQVVRMALHENGALPTG